MRGELIEGKGPWWGRLGRRERSKKARLRRCRCRAKARMAYCREMGSCRGGVLRRSFLRSRNRDPPWASLQARLAVLMRLTLLATLALIALRVVIGLHFFLEGSSHLQDPQWSSLGFRRAAVGPLADFYRKSIPEPGNFSGTVAALDDRPTDEVIAAWEANVVTRFSSTNANT